jgi:hypothetical protein
MSVAWWSVYSSVSSSDKSKQRSGKRRTKEKGGRPAVARKGLTGHSAIGIHQLSMDGFHFLLCGLKAFSESLQLQDQVHIRRGLKPKERLEGNTTAARAKAERHHPYPCSSRRRRASLLSSNASLTECFPCSMGEAAERRRQALKTGRQRLGWR